MIAPVGIAATYRTALAAHWQAYHAHVRTIVARTAARPVRRDASGSREAAEAGRQIGMLISQTWSHKTLDPLLTTVSGRVDKHVKASLPTLSLKTNIGGKEALWRMANVKLITGTAEREREQVAQFLDVMNDRNVHPSDPEFVNGLDHLFSDTDSRADFIARDQTLKLAGQVNRERQTQAGIALYEWSTSADERVRPMHADLDGEVIAWGDPPETNDDGDTNDPGQDYQCRCIAIPILPDEDYSSDDDSGGGDDDD